MIEDKSNISTDNPKKQQKIKKSEKFEIYAICLRFYLQIVKDLMQANRKVYDSVYGFIEFPLHIWQFIDTPHFQRLRNIKQLGCLSWVFPGATHTRFEHSLGTGHLAQKYIKTIIEKHRNPTLNKDVYDAYYNPTQRKEFIFRDNIIQEAIFTVTLAGIMHDIGHGPYSHLFDAKVVQNLGDGTTWSHQLASIALIDCLYKHVIKEHKRAGNSEKETQKLSQTRDRVKALIIGKITEKKYKPSGDKDKKSWVYDGEYQVENLSQDFREEFKKQLKIRPWQFQLISNRITGIDVDKLDYFRRDAYYLGAKDIYIDHDLLMNETLVLHDSNAKDSEKHRLCYPTKYSDKVYDIYYSRYRLYKTYYLSLKANGVDFMLADVLKLVEPYFRIKQICNDLVKNGQHRGYIRLTDSILERVENRYQELREAMIREETLEQNQLKILMAGRILQKLNKRQIYDFIKEEHKSFTFANIGSYYFVKEELKNLKNELEKNNPDLVIGITDIGFGIKDKDIFTECRFYDKTQTEIKITKDQKHCFSLLKPEGIVEISLRAYLKRRFKNPTPEEIDMNERISTAIKWHVNQIDKDFISGQTGTFSNRGYRNQTFSQASLQRRRNNIRDNNQYEQQFKDQKDQKNEQ